MKIELRLYASLKKYLPDQSDGTASILEVKEGTTVREVLTRLGIPLDAPKIIFLNGIQATGDAVLKDGDRLGAFPPVAGG